MPGKKWTSLRSRMERLRQSNASGQRPDRPRRLHGANHIPTRLSASSIARIILTPSCKTNESSLNGPIACDARIRERKLPKGAVFFLGEGTAIVRPQTRRDLRIPFRPGREASPFGASALMGFNVRLIPREYRGRDGGSHNTKNQ